MSKSKSRKRKTPKRVLALPDLEHAKTAVLNSLTSASGQRTYEHAIREFVAWYCSEPRLAFNRTVVLRYRIHLEQRGYLSATINLRLAAVRRIAYEAADAGLLSPELAAGICRVKGVRRIGVRLGNWLTPEQGRRLLEATTPSNPRQLRDQAMIAMLIGCGLRRALALTPSAFRDCGIHFVPQPAPLTDLIVAVARLLTTSGGHTSVDALATAHQVSRQHFTRRFRAATGLPPKQFARICRFQRLVQTLLTTDVDRWAAEASGLGFYDQAHMINDFREFAGESPTRFFQPHVGGRVAVPATRLRGRPHEWLRSGHSA